MYFPLFCDHFGYCHRSLVTGITVASGLPWRDKKQGFVTKPRGDCDPWTLVSTQSATVSECAPHPNPIESLQLAFSHNRTWEIVSNCACLLLVTWYLPLIFWEPPKNNLTWVYRPPRWSQNKPHIKICTRSAIIFHGFKIIGHRYQLTSDSYYEIWGIY